MASNYNFSRDRRVWDTVSFGFVGGFMDLVFYNQTFNKKDAYILLKNGNYGPKKAKDFEAEFQRIQTQEKLQAAKSGSVPRNVLFSALYSENKSLLFWQLYWTLAEMAFRLMAALNMWLLISCIQTSTDNRKQWLSWTSLVALCLCNLMWMMCYHMKQWVGEQIVYTVRHQVTNLLYSKLLKLNGTCLSSISTGTLVNMVTRDLQAIDQAIMSIMYIFVGPAELVITYILVAAILFPYAALAGCGIFLVLVPCQVALGLLQTRLRKEMAAVTDERIRLMSEAVQGIMAVKSQCWEGPVVDSIQRIRSHEAYLLDRIATLRTVDTMLQYFTPAVATLATAMVYLVQGGNLTSARLFYAMASFFMLRISLSINLVQAALGLGQGGTILSRFDKFLILDEPGPPPNMVERNLQLQPGTIVMSGASYDWAVGKARVLLGPELEEDLAEAIRESEPIRTLQIETSAPLEYVADRENSMMPVLEAADVRAEIAGEEADRTLGAEISGLPPTLSSVQLEVKAGELLAIVGDVGSGKSSLLAALLGDLTPVIPELSPDALPEPTVVGTVAYLPQSPWLVEGSVRTNILLGRDFDETWYESVTAACGLSRDFASMPSGDFTDVGVDGLALSADVKARLALARLAYSRANINLLDDPLSPFDARQARQIFTRLIGPGGLLDGSTRLLITPQRQFLPHCDRVLVLRGGVVVALGTWDELSEQGLRELGRSPILETTSMEGDAASIASSLPEQMLGPLGVDPEMLEPEYAAVLSALAGAPTPPPQYYPPPTPQAAPIPQRYGGYPRESESRRSIGGWKVLKQDFLQFALTIGIVTCVFLFVAFLMAEANFAIASWWVSWYSSIPVDGQFYYIYATLMVVLVVLLMIRAYTVYKRMLTVSSALHDKMVSGVINAPITFYSSTPSDAIINCTSKDINCLDDPLPLAVYFAAESAFSIASVYALVAVAVVELLTTLVPLALALLFRLPKYIAAQKEIMRLESETATPVLHAFVTTSKGVAVIRSTGSEEYFKNDFMSKTYDHATWIYARACASSWVGAQMEYGAPFIAFSMSLGLLLSTGDRGPYLLGLGLVFSIQLMWLLPRLLQQTGIFAGSLVAMRRVVQYGELPTEGDQHKMVAQRNGTRLGAQRGWPSSGEVMFESVSVSYANQSPLVLSEVSFVIQGGTRAGIVGASGSGKSTILLALLRIPVVRMGVIRLDGVDTARIDLKEARRHIAMIPQNPLLLSGTLRANLDPLNKASDDEVWEVLRSLRLASMVKEMGGLRTVLRKAGMNLSIGQKQLICLARALLQKAWVIGLDEATSGMDSSTQLLIKSALMRWAAPSGGPVGRVLIIVAHRLETVKSCSEVLVMADGRLIEQGTPGDLGSKREGAFATMLAAAEVDQSTPLPTPRHSGI